MGYYEISEFTQTLLNQEFEPDLKPSAFVWHYTDSQGLAGILKKRTVRLSNPLFLNDPSEIKTGLAVTEEVITELRESGTAGEKVFATEFDAFRKRERRYFPYVCSFCAAENDLTLWRLYAEDGFGFSLGCPISELREALTYQANRQDIPPNIYIYRVIYDPQRQRDLIRRLFKFIYQSYEEGSGGDQSQLQKEEPFGLLFEMIGFFLPLMKSDAYRTEQENRIVLHGHDVKYADMDFSPRKGFLKPYIDFPIEAETFPEMPIHTVYVGPQADFELAQESLRLYFENLDLAKYQITVKPSGLAYRK